VQANRVQMGMVIQMMKQYIERLMQIALKQLQESGELPAIPAFIEIDATKDKQHGDFASNIALILAKLAQRKPCEIAARIIEMLPPSPYLEKVEIAGPGFINFFLSLQALNEVVGKVLAEGETYGRCKMGRGKRILLEFLSANPTGPLHVGHGRHAAFGAVLSNLLDAVGFKTYKEYYVNDIGHQTDILTVSIWLRYLALCGETIGFPANAYQGDYVISIARAIYEQHRFHFHAPIKPVFENLPPDAAHGGDDEVCMDTLIEHVKHVLGDKYQAVFNLGLENILADIREDLAEFHVHFDNWFSERQFITSDTMVDKLLEKLKESEHVYEEDGALWFRATHFNDEKDRVLVRSNGQRTYFANDIAYHWYKFERGFDIAINVFGSDHHGYVARMKGAVEAANIDSERLIQLLVQFVTLYRGGEQIHMSTRGGNFVTLRELREEVGNDAARFFYIMRRNEQHMDFDLDLAKAESNENPVYYVQYAYARICSVFKQLEERHIVYDEAHGLSHLHLLSQSQERELLNTLLRYPDMIVSAALQYEPHLLTNYLRDLAADFHAYYNAHQFLVDDVALRNARLSLIVATRQTLLNGFNLLGISAPECM
jgi:arginyl-tRNA synthetase